MRRLLASVLFAALLPQALVAECNGTDLRATLSDAQRMELEQREAQTPFPTGNHWRATRGDRSINLIGTMHIADTAMDAPAARLQPVIEAADVLFVEVTSEDRATLEREIATNPSMLLLQGETLIDLLDEATWARLAQAAQDRGIPSFMAAKMQPWYLSVVLAMPPCALELMETANGLDARLEAIAVEADVPRRSIEPYDITFRLFTEEPVEEQLRMLRSGILPPDVGADMLETTINLYFEEAHAKGWEIARLLTANYIDLPRSEIDDMMDKVAAKLLDRRNIAWIEVIEAEQADSIVVAVGAAHLMGEKGLLQQLQERGYALKRLKF